MTLTVSDGDTNHDVTVDLFVTVNYVNNGGPAFAGNLATTSGLAETVSEEADLGEL